MIRYPLSPRPAPAVDVYRPCYEAECGLPLFIWITAHGVILLGSQATALHKKAMIYDLLEFLE